MLRQLHVCRGGWLVMVLLLIAPLAGCGPAYDPPPLAFEGPSTELKQTVVVPTLDTEVPAGQNVVWCSSFQVAWNKLKDDLAKGPVQLDKATELADKLNAAPQIAADLPEDSYYCAAGFVADGIVDEIREQMQQRFGKQPQIELEPDPAHVAIAYAYLEAQAQFTLPFFENDAPLDFVSSQGESVPVCSFGVREKDVSQGDDLREQVAVLYAREREKYLPEQAEFAIDPCKTSSPNQVVIARVPWHGSLAATLGYVQQRIASDPPEYAYQRECGPYDELLIPVMHWDIDHEFAELKKADFLNPSLAGLYLGEARQVIRFRLDRAGAALASEAEGSCDCSPRFFHATGPHLVYMKRRDREQPFFAVWVDNAELLVRPPGG